MFRLTSSFLKFTDTFLGYLTWPPNIDMADRETRLLVCGRIKFRFTDDVAYRYTIYDLATLLASAPQGCRSTRVQERLLLELTVVCAKHVMKARKMTVWDCGSEMYHT